MPKRLSKIILASIAIAGVVGGAIYITSIQSANNIAIADDTNTATLVSVWDKETELSYGGTKEITVYRSPNCGCCGGWIEHAQKHGFKVKDIKTDDLETVKQKYNVPTELAACHTAIIDGYVMEGHIPVDDIKRFLQEKPKLAGLVVPEMPIGTPGMESKAIKQPFQVLAFNNRGEIKVFKDYQSY